MSRIEELIEELCPDGVEYKELGEVCKFNRGTSITQKDTKIGEVPVIAGGQKPSYYHNSHNRKGDTIAVSGSGAYAGFVTFWTIPVFLSDSFSVDPNYEILIPKYVFYFLKSIQEKIHNTKKGSGVPHVHGSSIYKFQIPIPPLPIQEEIVRILDKFTELEAELEAELESRRKQYEYYCNQLLAFKGEDVEWKPLKSIAELKTGSRNTVDAVENGEYDFFVRSQNILKLDGYDFDDKECIITSGDGVGVGKILHYVSGKYGLHQRAYRIFVIDKSLNTKFLFYYMKNTFYRYIMRNSVSSSVTSVRKPMLEKYPIPIPPLSEQERIVDILDKFDALVNDISVGLPAEIEARRKQYEYYRSKLLSFEAK